MTSDENVNITIATATDFEPSEQLRAALDRVIELCEQGTEDEAEVQGFSKLQIGPNLTVGALPEKQGWRDGCWSFDATGDKNTCGWYQATDLGQSCFGFNW